MRVVMKVTGKSDMATVVLPTMILTITITITIAAMVPTTMAIIILIMGMHTANDVELSLALVWPRFPTNIPSIYWQ